MYCCWFLQLVVGEVGFLLEEEGFEATALGVTETSLAGGATGEVNLGAAMTFQAEVEVWVGAVEKVIIKEEGEATAEVA